MQTRMAANMLRAIVRIVAIATLSASALAEDHVPYTAHEVVAEDGTGLAVQEWGNPDGPAVLFVHGMSQSHLSWKEQVEDPTLADEFRMITFDLRGHGMSDKPEDPALYQESARWAGDLHAIIEDLELEDPVLVPSSVGGRVVSDYIVHFGEEEIAGLMPVGAVLRSEAEPWYGPALSLAEPMASDDLATALDGSRRFAESLFATPPPQEVVNEIHAYMMMTPRHVREAVFAWETQDYASAWRSLTVPILLTHGVEDEVIVMGMSESIEELVDHAETSYMDGVGHVPFLEAPEAFNEQLAEFVRSAHEE